MKKLIIKKSTDDKKKHAKLPSMQRVNKKVEQGISDGDKTYNGNTAAEFTHKDMTMIMMIKVRPLGANI